MEAKYSREKTVYNVRERLGDNLNYSLDYIVEDGYVHRYSQIGTRRKTYIIEYHTNIIETKEIELLSNEIFEKINSVKDKLKHLILSDKLYADICFVKVSDENDVVIKINKKLISISHELNLEINFDGF